MHILNKLSLLAAFMVTVCGFAKEVSILAPQNFVAIQRKGAYSSVKQNFLYKDKKGFVPSINLSEKKTNLKASAYIKELIEYYSEKPTISLQQLPKVKTALGKAYLFQINDKNKWGDIQLLQLIQISDKTVYTITACALKSEFSTYERDFLESFESLNIR